jgi:hypothetical protein
MGSDQARGLEPPANVGDSVKQKNTKVRIPTTGEQGL